MDTYPKVIYKITHDITKKIYIGSTDNYERRISQHLQTLRRGTHIVEDMQKDFDRYGENYTVEIIGRIACPDEIYKEYELMKEFNSHIRSFGYNYKDSYFKPKHSIVRVVKRKEVLRNRYPNVRAEMVRKGITLQKLAEMLTDTGLKMTAPKLSLKFNGTHRITLTEAKAIKKILNENLLLEVLFSEEAI